jgi:hypothetical protein
VKNVDAWQVHCNALKAELEKEKNAWRIGRRLATIGKLRVRK